MAAVWDARTQSWVVTLWGAHADSVHVHVVDRRDPFTSILDVAMVRSGDQWAAVVARDVVGDADLYGFRVDGVGQRYDASKFLLDPEATQVWFPPQHDRDAARIRGTDTQGRSPMGVLRRMSSPPPPTPGPRHAPSDLIIYELHVRGATKAAPDVPSELRGTFAGLRHHVPYIASLGVTAVELMPIHQCDPDEGSYWGYMPLAWNALHHEYVAGDDPEREFIEMVQAFHDAGIEVLLDVVYNHTTEEDELGPTFHLRAIDDASYYVVGPDGSYDDDAGCGNVVRAAHHCAATLIMGSLRRYADLGVDGFRFDLGSLLGRDLNGEVQRQSTLIDEISTFASMRGLRLITEPWDLRAYQLGEAFPGRTWAQWNGRFRDDVRSFIRGEEGFASSVALRISASPDIFGDDPQRSINFVTAHDGFTLYDLVSYERKHNEANGHDSTDGTDDNRSWNCGWEGDDLEAASELAVKALRANQMRNILCVLLLSRGVPMLLAGDEFAQTQHGNNNAYNQDNETAWLDWRRAPDFGELTDFVRSLVGLRARGGSGPITMFGVAGDPDLSFASHSLAWAWGDLYVVVNAWWEPLSFVVQSPGRFVVALATCADAPSVVDSGLIVQPRSAVVLRRIESEMANDPC